MADTQSLILSGDNIVPEIQVQCDADKCKEDNSPDENVKKLLVSSTKDLTEVVSIIDSTNGTLDDGSSHNNPTDNGDVNSTQDVNNFTKITSVESDGPQTMEKMNSTMEHNESNVKKDVTDINVNKSLDSDGISNGNTIDNIQDNTTESYPKTEVTNNTTSSDTLTDMNGTKDIICIEHTDQKTNLQDIGSLGDILIFMEIQNKETGLTATIESQLSKLLFATCTQATENPVIYHLRNELNELTKEIGSEKLAINKKDRKFINSCHGLLNRISSTYEDFKKVEGNSNSNSEEAKITLVKYYRVFARKRYIYIKMYKRYYKKNMFVSNEIVEIQGNIKKNKKDETITESVDRKDFETGFNDEVEKGFNEVITSSLNKADEHPLFQLYRKEIDDLQEEFNNSGYNRDRKLRKFIQSRFKALNNLERCYEMFKEATIKTDETSTNDKDEFYTKFRGFLRRRLRNNKLGEILNTLKEEEKNQSGTLDLEDSLNSEAKFLKLISYPSVSADTHPTLTFFKKELIDLKISTSRYQTNAQKRELNKRRRVLGEVWKYYDDYKQPAKNSVELPESLLEKLKQKFMTYLALRATPIDNLTSETSRVGNKPTRSTPKSKKISKQTPQKFAGNNLTPVKNPTVSNNVRKNVLRNNPPLQQFRENNQGHKKRSQNKRVLNQTHAYRANQSNRNNYTNTQYNKNDYRYNSTSHESPYNTNFGVNNFNNYSEPYNYYDNVPENWRNTECNSKLDPWRTDRGYFEEDSYNYDLTSAGNVRDISVIVANIRNMSEYECKLVTSALEHSVDRAIQAGGFVPSFKDHTVTRRGIKITCANSGSLEWLKIAISSIYPPFNGALLTVISELKNHFNECYTLSVYIPHSTLGATTILQRLAGQNKNIDTERWIVKDHKCSNEGSILYIEMDERSFQSLRAKNFSLYFGLHVVNFTLINK